VNADRAGMLARHQILATSEQNDSLDWILTGVPALWQDPAFARGPQTGDQMRRRLVTEWFGYQETAPGVWQQPQPPPRTTGYWIGYRGDVHRIVRRAVLWAIELSLGGDSNTTARPGAPWPIEFFWKCPAPWFEAWVVSRCVPATTTGLVTVVLVSPSHRGAVVSKTPIAHSAVATPTGASHPVPSFQADYEVVGSPHPTGAPPPGPANRRDHAMWVVTHERHAIANGAGPGQAAGRAREENTAGPRPFTDWSIPQLAVYEGSGNIVIVSPSLAAGGVKHDGSV
jgi:hypothetical protein